MQGADITIINRENLQWLIEESGFSFDFDMVIIDECPPSRIINQNASSR